MTESEKKCPDCGRELHVETLSWRWYCDYCQAHKVGGTTESEKKARAIAEDFAEKFYGLKNRGHSAYMETTIARALEEARNEALEEAAQICDQESKCYLEPPVCLSHSVSARGCANKIRALKERLCGGFFGS